jgi:WXG100 family type VII secretion target
MSLLFADPDELRATAGLISQHADTVRHTAQRLSAQIAAADWHGLAARAFRSQAHWVLAALRAAADRLDDAADALRRIATKLAAFLDDVRRTLHDAGQLAGDIGSIAGDLLTHPSELGGDLRDALGDLGHLGRDVADVTGDAVDGVLGLVGI